MRAHWRHFIPRQLPSLKRKTTAYTDVFERANQIVASSVVHFRLRDVHAREIDAVIDLMKQKQSKDAATWLALLILQSPRAAIAQQQMDKHPRGYHNKQERLYELIDFNDTYIDTVLSLPEHELVTFDDQVKIAMDRFSKQLGVRCFNNEQWDAITQGLSREIAVYRGAIKEGLSVRMTSRTEDAMGVDMVISDLVSRRSMNVDVKARSAFHFRLKDLAREKRISGEQLERAERVGYCEVVNGHGQEAIKVVLLRIDHEALGEIVNFNFENSGLLGRELRRILIEVG